ncbi:uncharacterized protein IL334_003362 [Kwoniella shivajii]|uniref:Enoyl reductase (ER) domain-containing protein n=1 Tax=Kwoniella shivajii TaxID=564305 RepID=A0ABZ1CXQ2_9TREE|nr:hypothetical protein IL334_003362 [Kwoniella shivajii]
MISNVPSLGDDIFACKLMGVEVLKVEKREGPSPPGPYEAVVAPQFNGLCGSDMHIYLTALLGEEKMKEPFVLGHEASGIVVATGSDVKNVKVGDRVALEPGEGCGRCNDCKKGAYNHCDDMKFAAADGRDGTLQGLYKLPSDLCYKLSDNISLEEGALIEPLAVAVNAIINIANLPHSSNVVVFGAGPVGLLTMAVAKALGSRRIIAIDIQEERLNFAKSYAATDIHVASPMIKGESKTDYSKRHAEIIKQSLGISDRGIEAIDVVIDCSAAEVCMQTGIWLTKRKGIYVQVGCGPLYVNLPMRIIADRELTVKGCFRYGPGVYTRAIDLVSRGLIDLKPLITHKYPWEQASKAFTTTKAGKGDDGRLAIKVMIGPPPKC